jgi:predicted metal-dependent phosphoesterase TrpH
MNQPSLRVDFHTHTYASTDSLNQPQVMLRACTQRKVDRLIITDHNTIRVAQLAKKMDPERIIVGEEVLTQQGELLAAFVEEEIPAGLPALEAVHRLRDQGAFISVSHPFDLRRHGWKFQDLIEILPFVDAIEIANARCFDSRLNQKAQVFAQQHQIPGTAGSDAHGYPELGRMVLNVPFFSTADELRKVISQGQPEGRTSPIWALGYTLFAKSYKRITRREFIGKPN